MICLLSDLNDLERTGQWRLGAEVAAALHFDIDKISSFFSIINTDIANSIGLDIEDANQLKDMIAFAANYIEDRKLDNRLINNIPDDNDLIGFLDNRIQYYDQYREHDLVSFQASMMACSFRAKLLTLLVEINRRNRNDVNA